MRRFALIRRMLRDQSGATLLEFAFVAPVLVLMLIGGMDVGYTIYIQSIASGTLESVSRSGSLEGATESQIRHDIRQSIFNILPNYAQADSNVTVTTKNYTDYSRINSAEKIVLDNDNDGTVDSGDCWIDEDANNLFGTNEGKNGIGGADDSVYYTVDISVRNLFPMHAMLGLPATRTITVKTLVVNQPYGSQATRPTVCKP